MKRSALNIMLRLIVLVKPLLLFMILAVLMGVIGNLMASFITVLGGYGILNILKGNEDLKIIFILLIVFALVRGFLRYGEQTCNHYIAFKLLALIREKVFRALRKLCPARLEVKNSGDLISLITSDIELLEVFYAHTVSPVSIAFIYSLIMVFFIGHYHLVLGLVALVAYIVIGLIIPVYVNSLVKNDGLLFRNAQGLLSSFVLDSLRGLREILQFNKGEKELNELDYRTNELLAIEERMKNKNAFNLSFTNTVIYLFDLIMLICASLLYFNNLISFEALIISVIALMSSFGPVVALASLGTTLPNTLAAGERVLDILDEKPLIEEVKNKENTVFNKLEAENIYFSYGDELILDDISLNIRKGETVGIEGRSGSGKSTLLKLFMRFWDINKGDIKISNKDIKEINTSDLRNMESFMYQDTHLFHDSILNNIKIAKLNASLEEVYEAAKKANIHDFIMSLPEGYDTEVGELGDTLSGGEKQRISLARCFLHDGDLLLLDEPTSNLDSLSESIILKSLKEERKDKTIVLVSHRKSTLRIVDRIIQMKESRVS